MNNNEIKEVIEKNKLGNFYFGDRSTSPGEEWIEKAEVALGEKLPPSYKFFLENFGGGSIRGDEVFSIYKIPFDQAVGGDIVYKTRMFRNRGEIKSTDIAICETDFGELFVMDASSSEGGSEYPVIRIFCGDREKYADRFGDFIIKFSEDNMV